MKKSVAIVGMLFALSAAADTRIVDPINGPYATIQAAIDAIASGAFGTVYVKEGTYANEVGMQVNNLKNRIYSNGRYVRLVSADGIGKETWCAYHALEKPNPSGKPQLRYLHLQKVGFDVGGYPQMDPPIPTGESRPAPSGER